MTLIAGNYTPNPPSNNSILFEGFQTLSDVLRDGSGILLADTFLHCIRLVDFGSRKVTAVAATFILSSQTARRCSVPFVFPHTWPLIWPLTCRSRRCTSQRKGRCAASPSKQVRPRRSRTGMSRCSLQSVRLSLFVFLSFSHLEGSRLTVAAKRCAGHGLARAGAVEAGGRVLCASNRYSPPALCSANFIPRSNSALFSFQLY